MTGTLLRILIFGAIIVLILWGLRKIWRDWTGQFRQLDKERHERDLRERQRPDVITLRRDKDGKFRPPEDDGRS